MKTLIKACFFLLVSTLFNPLNAQDSLSIDQLNPITYTFNIENGVLKGEGAQFLKEEMSKAQFTLIGEYHESTRISELTSAMIPVLDSAGYKTLVLEVGPASGQILNRLKTNVTEELKIINNKYLIRDDDGYVDTPIPFFSYVEDADFLEKAKSLEWHVMGIDQEYFYSYQMLLDKLYENLDQEEKTIHANIYKQAKDSLAEYYIKDEEGGTDLVVSIKNSEILEQYFSKVEHVSNNREIIEALKTSNHIYWLNWDRQWFENNATRVKYMKSQLKSQLTQNQFDLSQDKLLIKMGGYHLSKGFSPLGLYEVGNMLNELANFHGNTALNITFSNRFYMEEGQLIDILESESKYDQRLKDLNQMGRKNEWVVIDLRPMVKGHFYRPVKYKFNKYIKELIQRYDLLIIPKIEVNPTPNYDTD